MESNKSIIDIDISFLRADIGAEKDQDKRFLY